MRVLSVVTHVKLLLFGTYCRVAQMMKVRPPGCDLITPCISVIWRGRLLHESADLR